jgi:tetratricopeptide (TPR) repeat protein
LNERDLLQAREALNCGRFDDAASTCREYLRQSPEDPAALAILGTSLARLGKASDGLEPLARAASLQPSNVATLIEASICARLAGRHDEAVEFGRRGVELEPNNPKARCMLGLALTEAANPEEALSQLQEAARLAPSNPQILHNLALVLELCGREREALEQFRKVVNLAPAALGSRLALANLLLKYGNPGAALREVRLCLEQDPSNLAALLLAARASDSLSLSEDADRLIDRALAIKPDENAAVVMKGFRAQASGNFQAAKKLFERALEINPIQGACYWGLRQGAIADRQDLAQVEKILGVAEKLPLGSLERAYAHFAIAKTYADLQMYKESMAHYDVANGDAAIAQRVYSRYDPEAFPRFLSTCQAIFAPEFFLRHSGLANPSRQPIFIVGMMRSGTTLMEQILSSHPEVTAAGEQHFWTSLAPSLIHPASQELNTDRVRSFQLGYLDLLGRYSSSGRVTDKMPENARFIGLIKILFPNAKIIHMDRDMVDVGLSIYATPYEVSPDFAHVQAHIAEACRNHLRLMSFWRSSLPSRSFLDVRYSELIDHPGELIRTVLEYCDLPWSEDCLRHTENERSISTPSVWQARQPIYSSSRGRWKNFAPYLGDLLSLAEQRDDS